MRKYPCTVLCTNDRPSRAGGWPQGAPGHLHNDVYKSPLPSLFTAAPSLKKIGKELLSDFFEARGGCTQATPTQNQDCLTKNYQKLLTPLPWGQWSVLCQVKRCNISRVLFAIIKYYYRYLFIYYYRYLQIPWVFPRGCCCESKKAIQSPHHARVKLSNKVVDKSRAMTARVCSLGYPLPRSRDGCRLEIIKMIGACSGWKHKN